MDAILLDQEIGECFLMLPNISICDHGTKLKVPSIYSYKERRAKCYNTNKKKMKNQREETNLKNKSPLRNEKGTFKISQQNSRKTTTTKKNLKEKIKAKKA